MQEQILYFFQAHSSTLWDRLFEIFTMFGEDLVIITVLAWIYWNHDKKRGFILTYTLIFSIVINNILKIVFRSPRPYQVLNDLKGKRVQTATGYSFPSGHTQGATTFYSSLSRVFKKPIFYVFSIITVFVVALSRVYLGVHWPVDVLASILLGIIISFIMVSYLTSIADDNARKLKFIIVLNVSAGSALIAVLIIKIFFLNGNLKTDDLIKTIALLNGVSWGFLLDFKKDSFIVDAAITRKILRFILGLAGAFLFVEASKAILPYSGLFHYLRYFAGGIWITYIFPVLGAKISLFQKSD